MTTKAPNPQPWEPSYLNLSFVKWNVKGTLYHVALMPEPLPNGGHRLDRGHEFGRINAGVERDDPALFQKWKDLMLEYAMTVCRLAWDAEAIRARKRVE